MVLLQVLVLLLAAFARPSRAVYCICKDGASKEAMQNDIDYACGSGADCNGILPSGPCYLPNTVKDHCNYAVNSYFQRQAQATGSCNFSGSATTSAVIPNQVAGCVYQASPSSTTLTPPSPIGATPTTGTPPAIPTTGTPPAIPTTGTPPAIPTTGTPPAIPTTGTPPAIPTTGTPPAIPTTGTPPAIPTMDTPPAIPTTDTPPATIVTPGLGPTSGTYFNNGATFVTLGKGTSFVVLLIVAWILG